MVGIPRSGREVLTEPVDDPPLDPRLEKRPCRLRGADLRIEQRLGPSPERLKEPVDAVGQSVELEREHHDPRAGDAAHPHLAASGGSQ